LLVSTALQNLAGVFADQADLRKAKEIYGKVLTIRREIGDKSGIAHALNGLANVMSKQGHTTAARKMQEESLTIRTELGEKGNISQSLLDLASLDIDEGHYIEAEMRARKAIDEYRSERASDAEARARAVCARSLLAQDQPQEARRTIDRALYLASKSQDRGVRFSVGITSARVCAALCKTAEARAKLTAVLAEAKRHGFVGHLLDARLALSEIDMRSANSTAGRARLAAIEEDAAAKEFLLIARAATNLQKSRN
jgi:tetratricopeptide (TPR) repeat protein